MQQEQTHPLKHTTRTSGSAGEEESSVKRKTSEQDFIDKGKGADVCILKALNTQNLKAHLLAAVYFVPMAFLRISLVIRKA